MPTRCPQCLIEVTVGADGTTPETHCRSCGYLLTDAESETLSIAPAEQLETIIGGGSSEESRGDSGSRPATATAPKVLGNYRIVREIARGGMGIVYQAVQTKLGRTVALKVIRSGGLASDDEVQRFRVEAEAAARLEHPGIVPVYDVGESDGQHYFSMGFVEGASLSEQLRDGPFAPRRAAEIVAAVAAAVHYAHTRGIVHRDLKPANVLIDKSGQPKVTDFGLAKRSDADSQLTRTGDVMGTPSYMPPEQASGRLEEIGPLCDVYSLGGVLYALLTGRPPFQAANVVETLRQVLERDPVSPRQLNPAVPRDLETICLKCLEKLPRNRYGSALELADELGRYLRDEPIRARPISGRERAWRWCRRNPVLAFTSAAALVSLVAIAVVMTVGYFREADLRRLADDARHNMQTALTNEKTARADAERHSQEAEDERHATQKLLAESYVDRGRFLCQQNELAQGLLWMSRGLRTLPENEADAERLIRARIGAWERQLPRRLTQVSHSAGIVAAKFSPDGQWFATASVDGTARLWDTSTGNPHGAPLVHQGGVYSVDIDAEGRRLLTCGADHTARLWSLPDLKPLGEPVAHPAAVRCALFIPGTNLILTIAADRKLHLHDLDTRQPRREPIALSGEFRAADVSPDGQIAVVGNGSQFMLLNPATGESLAPTIANHGLGQARSISIRPDGKVFAAVGIAGDAKTGILRFWELPTGRPLGERIEFGRGEMLNAAAYSPDGESLILGQLRGVARLWSPREQREIGSFLHTDRSIRVVDFHTTRNLVLVGGDDGTASVWSVVDPDEPLQQWQHSTGIYELALSPDESRVLVSGINGVAGLYDARSGEPIGPPLQHGTTVAYLDFDAEGSLAATSSFDGTVRLWNALDGSPAGEPLSHPAGVCSVEFHPDGTQLLTACQDGIARLWDLTSRRVLAQTPDEPGGAYAAAFRSDGKQIATGVGVDVGKHWGKLHLWDSALQPLLPGPMEHPSLIINTTFLRRRELILSNCNDGAVRVWNPETGEQVGPALWHPGLVYFSSEHPELEYFATSCIDGRVRFWDLRSLKQFGPDLVHDDAVCGLAFTADGTRLLTGSHDKGIRFWDAPRPAEGTSEEIERRLQHSTGLRLNEAGEVERLDNAAWQVLHAGHP